MAAAVSGKTQARAACGPLPGWLGAGPPDATPAGPIAPRMLRGPGSWTSSFSTPGPVCSASLQAEPRDLSHGGGWGLQRQQLKAGGAVGSSSASSLGMAAVPESPTDLVGFWKGAPRRWPRTQESQPAQETPFPCGPGLNQPARHQLATVPTLAALPSGLPALPWEVECGYAMSLLREQGRV